MNDTDQKTVQMYVKDKDEASRLKWLLKATCKPKVGRLVLEHICLKGKRLVASNGFMLFEADAPEAVDVIHDGDMLKPVHTPVPGPNVFTLLDVGSTFPDTEAVKPLKGDEKMRFCVNPKALAEALSGFEDHCTVVVYRNGNDTIMLEVATDPELSHNYALVMGMTDNLIVK